MLNYNSPPVVQLRTKILEIEAKPKPKHVNIIAKHYHVNGKKDHCLIALTDTVYDILSIRYYTQEDYPKLRLYAAGLLISTVTEEVEMLPMPYIPVQPSCKAVVDIYTDRKTTGELVIIYGERLHPEEGTSVVTHDRTRIFMNEEGFVNTLPLKKHDISYHLLWYDTATYALHIKEFITKVFVITKKKTHRVRSVELNNIVKKEFPLWSGNIPEILQELGVIYKRRTDGMYYYGLINKKDLSSPEVTASSTMDTNRIEDLVNTVKSLREAVLYMYNKLSMDSEAQRHVSILQKIDNNTGTETETETEADTEPTNSGKEDS